MSTKCYTESESESESVSTGKKGYTSTETETSSTSVPDDPVEGVQHQQPSNSEKQQPIPNSLRAKQQGCSQLQSSSTSKIEKGSTPTEVTAISEGQYLEGKDKQAKEKANNKFPKKFSFQDEEIILKALLKSGHQDGTSEFWTAVGHSLKLSIPVTQRQMYRKVQRLKENYVKKSSAENSNHAMSRDEKKLHKLCKKIWGAVLKPKEGGYEKNPQPVLVEEPGVSGNFKKFVRAISMGHVNFPVEEALNSLPASKRPKLEQQWNDLDVSMLQLYTRKMELIEETIRGVAAGK